MFSLSISELFQRKPRELSGGQRQRVAIGRALVRRPQVFLMDEPLSNLDAKLRVQMRAELLNLHQSVGITTIYVTHDQTEAMTLGDRVVMNKGDVQQVDAPDRLYRRPANVFVAGFIGSPAMNFLRGNLSDGAVQLGPHRVTLPETVKSALKGRTGRVVVGLRPEDFVLATANGNSGEATLPAEVQITEQLGPEVLLHFRAEGIEIATSESAASAQDEVAATPIANALIARVDPGFRGTRGERVQLRINRDHLQLFDPTSGESLLRA